MRILDWECVVSPDGNARGASHRENGTVAFVNGRIVAACDAPAEVVQWLMRPQLREAWNGGHLAGLGRQMTDNQEQGCDPNPYNGEPPNKDLDPS